MNFFQKLESSSMRQESFGMLDDRKWAEEHMLTVEKLIEHLKKFDPKALVCQFEVNTGDWQEQTPENLSWLVRTAKDEREYLMTQPRLFHEGKMEEEIDDILKYVQDNDVLIRF